MIVPMLHQLKENNTCSFTVSDFKATGNATPLTFSARLYSTDQVVVNLRLTNDTRRKLLSLLNKDFIDKYKL